jgi:hypothetical protein
MTEYRMRQMNGTLEVDESIDFRKQYDTCDKMSGLKKKKDCHKKLCATLTDADEKKDCLAMADALKK